MLNVSFENESFSAISSLTMLIDNHGVENLYVSQSLVSRTRVIIPVPVNI